MLADYEIKAIDHDLLDRNVWAAHAVAENIYPDTETALHAKAPKCLRRMVNTYNSTHAKLSDTLSDEDKVTEILKDVNYKNRVQREAEA